MASNATEGGLPAGDSPPLAIITSSDHSGVVLITTALALSFTLVSLLIRIFIRFEHRNPSYDDLVCAFATVFAVVQSSVVFFAVTKGFGKTVTDIPPTNLIPLQKALYAGDIFYVVTLWLTKYCVAILFFHLSAAKGRFAIVNTISCWVTIVLAFASTIIVALRCDLAHPWIFIGATCSSLFTRWQVVTALDIITEVAIFSVIAFLIQGLQLSLFNKFTVILSFAFRLLMIIPATFRLHNLHIEFSSTDPTLAGVLASVCTQIEMNYAIIAASTPYLRPFMRALVTHYGMPAESQPVPPSKATKRRNTFSLTSLSEISKYGRSEEMGTKALYTVDADQKASHEQHGGL